MNKLELSLLDYGSEVTYDAGCKMWGWPVPKPDPPCSCGSQSYNAGPHGDVCAGCGILKGTSKVAVQHAKRDGNGSLLCENCVEPYPYAEPDAEGHFICASCRAWEWHRA